MCRWSSEKLNIEPHSYWKELKTSELIRKTNLPGMTCDPSLLNEVRNRKSVLNNKDAQLRPQWELQNFMCLPFFPLSYSESQGLLLHQFYPSSCNKSRHVRIPLFISTIFFCSNLSFFLAQISHLHSLNKWSGWNKSTDQIH